MWEFCKKHAVISSVILAEGAGILISLALSLRYILTGYYYGLFAAFFDGIIAGTFCIYPLVLIVFEFIYLILGIRSARVVRQGKIFDAITFVLGAIYTALYGVIIEICFDKDWTETLYNSEVHAPVYTQAWPTVIAVAMIALAGYLILTYIPLRKLPPLVIVTAVAAIYLGMAECILWSIQILAGLGYFIMCLAPFAYVMIGVKTIRNAILEWSPEMEESRTYRYRWLKWCNGVLAKSGRWPAAAFVLMWPLLGILICLLVLFGQQPDSIIRAWTETSDWNLSQRAAPQNIYYDEHYLCTVAAGGHENVVKPRRLGVRHGHWVIVNRQLCIANAFEQILEERTPRFHRHVRHFYDTYGFPIAKAIHSPYIADVIYFVMKPLEWLFLIVLYFCDVKPENRIAVQYTGRLPKEVKEAVYSPAQRAG